LLIKPKPERIEPLCYWNDFRLQLVWVYTGFPSKHYRFSSYEPKPQMAWLIRKGSVTLKFPLEEEIYSAGQFSDDAEILSIRFIAEWPTGEYLFDRSKSYSRHMSELREFTRISERLSRAVFREFPDIYEQLPTVHGSNRCYFSFQRLLYGWIQAYSLVMEGFGLSARTIGTIDERIRGAIHTMERQRLSQLLREKELAASSGLSVSQFNKLFHRDIGMTPKAYWENKRIENACIALQGSTRSIKSIAIDLGFSSLPHFSGWVKKNLGKSPREFRSTKD
jgi:AraC-like DNA-binding protein